ncbi:hypothetical protein M434DRAFT_13059 [Hypoxylon sp. CO27-5]|nr:hypothetical protein M434DRAFT_13059 [Hypoxylon sp. CO27-5]
MTSRKLQDYDQVKLRSRIFNECVIAVAGFIDHKYNKVNVSRWTLLHGGSFDTVVDKGVTHVLTTPTEFKKKTEQIEMALKINAHIVTAEWLEDSLNAKRKLNEEEYSLDVDRKKELKEKKELEEPDESEFEGFEDIEALDDTKKLAEELGTIFINPNLFHIYRDGTHFPYQVTLTQKGKDKNVGDKHVLYLWVSITKPRRYRFAVKSYMGSNPTPIIFRPSDEPGGLEREFNLFKEFFRTKCGIEWDDRLTKARIASKGRFEYQGVIGGNPIDERRARREAWRACGDVVVGDVKPMTPKRPMKNEDGSSRPQKRPRLGDSPGAPLPVDERLRERKPVNYFFSYDNDDSGDYMDED